VATSYIQKKLSTKYSKFLPKKIFDFQYPNTFSEKIVKLTFI